MDAAHAAALKQVVLTSSTAAVYMDGGNKPGGAAHVYTGADWSDEQYLRSNKLYYPLSKVLAEREAHRLAKQYDIALSVMCPTLIVGEMLHEGINTSHAMVLKFVDGSSDKYSGQNCFVDVGDVAEAHINAIDDSSTFGERILLITVSAAWSSTCKLLQSIYPTCTGIPTDGTDADLVKFNNDAFVALLGHPPVPLLEMMKTTVDSLATRTTIPGITTTTTTTTTANATADDDK
eukprot:CAMPEP_0198335076 /NCGR_PEP_ID=MMETSP1450-20131203/20053_1 /TAXON_ID=753684 ORGANISM="Madagascaria erythrocladiodes, Strain CCMP3234" /NCGR_SAMPLE_ID=MMETSP1450 /ASSEMBLY_ACC=CAM_ASM_001115 /LENGTH=233 /DNA_ID=CAMNT_0044039707 /DNA_START=10 /DNA_END=711 /DNA_ORIENTATION=+